MTIKILKNGEVVKEIDNPYPDLNVFEPVYTTRDLGETWQMYVGGPDVVDGSTYDGPLNTNKHPWAEGEQREICKRMEKDGLIDNKNQVKFPNLRFYTHDGDRWIELWLGNIDLSDD